MVGEFRRTLIFLMVTSRLSPFQTSIPHIGTPKSGRRKGNLLRSICFIREVICYQKLATCLPLPLITHTFPYGCFPESDGQTQKWSLGKTRAWHLSFCCETWALQKKKKKKPFLSRGLCKDRRQPMGCSSPTSSSCSSSFPGKYSQHLSIRLLWTISVSICDVTWFILCIR